MVGSLAQLAEHLTLNQGVTGSIPVRSTIFIWAINSVVECHLHTVEVVGSNPISPTIVNKGLSGFSESPFYFSIYRLPTDWLHAAHRFMISALFTAAHDLVKPQLNQ